MNAGRLLPLRLCRWWPFFESSGLNRRVDPLLLAAICDRESLGGDSLFPRGPGGTGDNGHGRGLMQVDDRAFPAFCAGGDWKDPAKNIDFGAAVLARAMAAFNGDEACAVAAYNAGVDRVREALAELTEPADPMAILASCDSVTTGGDYVSDVFRRRRALTIPRSTTIPSRRRT